MSNILLILFYSAVFSLEQTARIALIDHIEKMAIVTSMLMHPFFPSVLHQDHWHDNDEGNPDSFQLEKIKESNRKILRD